MARYRRILPLVVGTVVLATGVIVSGMPASAQIGRVDLAGRSGVIEAVTMGDRVADQTAPAGDCWSQMQRYWDGFDWRSQRTIFCD